MQTFLPYPDFAESARCLDYRRLGKQRTEAKQILRTLFGITNGWRHHPAVKMWRGYEGALAMYGRDICIEWRRRGYRDVQLEVFEAVLDETDDLSLPLWLGDEAFHLSHRSNLKRKKPEHYGMLWPDVPADLPYIWPA
jgi:hypothetical protein